MNGMITWLVIGLLSLNLAVGQSKSASLDKLHQQYEEQQRLLKHPLTELQAKYSGALEALRDDLQSKGDLEGALAAKAELTRLVAEKAPPRNQSKVGSIRRLQEIYNNSHLQILTKLSTSLETAHIDYRKRLGELVTELTQSGKLAEALKVRQTLENLTPFNSGVTTLETELVLHLTFDDAEKSKVFDSSNAGNHGRLLGNASIRNGNGKRARFLYLDGSGDFAEIPHHESLNLKSNASISVWIQPKEVRSLAGFVSKYHPHNSWTLRFQSHDFNRMPSFGDYHQTNSCLSQLKVGNWTHLVVSQEGGIIRFYQNGKLDHESKRPNRPLPKNNNPVRVGSCALGRFFKGSFDELRIYRRALSANEVAQIYRKES